MTVGRLGGAAWVATAILMPVAIAGTAAWESGGASFLVAVHACARAVATASSLPAVLAVALAASVWGLLLWHLSRPAFVGRRAIRLAHRHAVPPPARVLELAGELGIRRLVVTDLPCRLAFCAGVIRPTVVLSSGLLASLPPAAVRAVMAHEAAHSSRRDPLRRVITHAAARALWIVPAARHELGHSDLRREIAADRHARARAGTRALAEALLALHDAPPPSRTPAIAGGGTQLGARIDALESGEAPAPPRLDGSVQRLSVAGFGIAALLVLAVVLSPATGPDAIGPMPMDGPAIADMTVAWTLRAAVLALVAMGVRHLRRAGRAATSNVAEPAR